MENKTENQTEDKKRKAGEDFFKWIRSSNTYRGGNKILGGVCSGLAQKFGWNLAFIRIVFLLIICFVGFGLVLYSILWVLLPDEKDQIGLEKAMFYGKFDVDNIVPIIFFCVGATVGLSSLIFRPFYIIVGALLILAIIYACVNAKGKNPNIIFGFDTDSVNKTFDKINEKVEQKTSEASAKANMKIDEVTEKIKVKTQEKTDKYKEKINSYNYDDKIKVEMNQNNDLQKLKSEKIAWKKKNVWPSGLTISLYGLGFITLGLTNFSQRFGNFNGHEYSLLFGLVAYTILVGLITVFAGFLKRRPSAAGYFLLITIMIICFAIGGAIYDDPNVIDIIHSGCIGICGNF